MKVRSMKSTIMLFLLCCAVIVTGAVLTGCAGSDGATGAAGAPGAQGPQGTPGADLTTGTVDAGSFTFDDLRNVSLSGKIISASTSSNQPVVTFQVINKNTGEGIRGLRTFSLHVAQLNPEANGSNSFWKNYILNSSNKPTTDAVTTFNADGTVNVQGYSVVDNLDGTYVVTFQKNIKSIPTVTYDATLTHRIVVGVRSVVVPGVVGKTPGAYAGPINPVTGVAFGQFTNTNGVNFAYDFVPSTGAVLTTPARDIVTIDACNQCHSKIQYGFPLGNNTSGHMGSRTDTKTCVMCHTPQNVASGQTATTNADFTPFIHKIHMGADLPAVESGLTGTLEGTYPQDIRNCTMCHKGNAVDNWKTKPTRKACGSCHNNVNFATSFHPSASTVIRTDDSACTLCHDAVAITDAHLAVELPDPNDPRLGGTNTHTYASYLAAAGVVPTGANVITYVVSNVSTSTIGGVLRPQIKFKFQMDGTDVAFVTAATTTSELGIPNFVGSPSLYFAWAVPQDGITTPVDFNASANVYLKNLWNGSATGSITGPVGGYYTAILTGTTITTSAQMLTGGVGYVYGSATPPLVQTNMPAYPYNFATGVGGLSVAPPNVWKTGTGYTARRAIVSNAKCNACHVQLGVKPTFHSGQRNDAPTCVFCHNVNRVNSGWGVNIKEAVHSIHAAAKRVNKFSWEAIAGATYWDVTYPGILKNCEQCHLAGMYDFSNSAYTANSGALLNNLLWTTVATGLTSTTATNIIVIKTGNETVLPTDAVISPFISSITDYGSGFSNSGGGVITPAAATTLVNSPIASACFACHDTAVAKSHMVLNGGSIYEARSTALANAETCIICHGPAANTAYGDFVPAIKAVHRWW